MLLKEKIESNFRDLTSFGGYMVLFPLIIFIYLINLKDLAFQLLLAFVVTYMIILIIRLFYFKERPVKERYNTFLSRIDSASFPSGHSARTISFALIFVDYFKNNVLTLFLIILVLFVCYSRIYLKKHYWNDVIVGLFIGIITALFILIYL